jgi:hypothetical protein
VSLATADPRRKPPYPYRRHRRIVLGVLALLVAAGVAVALILILGGGDDEPTGPPPGLSFRSEPDMHPPGVTVVKSTGRQAPGDIFLAPKRLAPQAGPMIVDGKGRLVWFHRVPKGMAANSFRVQRYQGKPVLTWWTGFTDGTGHGHGTYYIADTHYRIIKRVHAGNGLQGDLHDFRITPQGTALITIYRNTTANLSSTGGAKKGKVIDSVVQELDLKTGKVLFEWHSLKHVPVNESYITVDTQFAKSDQGYFDYFHVNSVTKLKDGNYLVSGRNVDAAYKVNAKTGKVMWTLGGKHPSFKMGPGTRFAFQHDVEEQPDGTFSVFDNGASPKVHDESRVLILRIDRETDSVILDKQFTHPEPISAQAEGNAQRLPNGDYFVNWGFGGFVAEFAPDGTLVFDAKLPPEVESYRGFRFAGWHGRPLTKPAVAVAEDQGRLTVFASWNGATDVARWVALAGPKPKKLKKAGQSQREGFETTIGAKGAGPYVAARALDARGRVLGTSKVVKVKAGG